MGLSFALMPEKTQAFAVEGDKGTLTFALGALSGVMYLANFLFYKYNMKCNGIVMSATFMKLGVLVPTIMAVLAFEEMPRATQVIGILVAVARKRVALMDLIYGALIGIPNYFSSRFLLLSLQEVEAVLVYPTYSVATMIIIAIAGTMLFHEKMSRKKACALGLILIALVLLNV